MYTIKLVDPRKEPSGWEAIAAGEAAHVASLGAFGAGAEFNGAGRVFGLAFFDSEGVPLAGARIHIRDNEHPLPLERQLRGDVSLRRQLDRRAAEGVGEVAGLWSSEALAASGIAGSVVAAAAAQAPVLGVRHLVAFVRQEQPWLDALGFRHDEDLDEQAEPDVRPRSDLRWCDTEKLAGSERMWRLAILMQRRNLLRGRTLQVERAAPAAGRWAAVGRDRSPDGQPSRAGSERRSRSGSAKWSWERGRRRRVVSPNCT